jgi:hypothetical protein
VGVPVCVPIPGLGVTVPVFCAAAILTVRANTDDANKILRINLLPFDMIFCGPSSRDYRDYSLNFFKISSC